MDNTEHDQGMFGGLVNKAKEMLGGSHDPASAGQDTFGQRTHEGEGAATQDESSGYGTDESVDRETTAQDRPVTTGVGSMETGGYARDSEFNTGAETSSGTGSNLAGDEGSSSTNDYGTGREGGNL